MTHLLRIMMDQEVKVEWLIGFEKKQLPLGTLNIFN